MAFLRLGLERVLRCKKSRQTPLSLGRTHRSAFVSPAEAVDITAFTALRLVGVRRTHDFGFYFHFPIVGRKVFVVKQQQPNQPAREYRKQKFRRASPSQFSGHIPFCHLFSVFPTSCCILDLRAARSHAPHLIWLRSCISLSPEFFNLPIAIEVVSGFSLLPAAISHTHLLPVRFR